jgi:hypothetical protein
MPHQPDRSCRPGQEHGRKSVVVTREIFCCSNTLNFEKNFEGEVDEGIEWLITSLRLRPDQSAVIAIANCVHLSF